MLQVQEIGNVCYLYGSKDLIEEIQFDILTILRDKEKDVLRLFKSQKPGTLSTKSKSSKSTSLSTLGEASITMPAGLIAYLIQELDNRSIPYSLIRDSKLPRQKIYDDLLYSGSEPITLRDYQVTSIRKAMTHRRGIFNIATGGGKTEIILGIAKMHGKSLTVVPSKSSLKQTFARFKKRGITDVGRCGGGYKELKAHTVATASMLNSRLKNGDVDIRRYLKSVNLLMFDEVHHLGTAPSWQRVGDECPAPFRYGFSGSPWASGMPFVSLSDPTLAKFADFRVTAQVGETLVYIPSKMLRDMGVIVDPRIYVIPVSEPQGLSRNPFPQWRWVYKNGIIENEHRNNLVVDASLELSKLGHKTAILVVSISHGKKLLELLHMKGLKAAFTIRRSSL
jgi:superfamily II DNA or RNA helicase